MIGRSGMAWFAPALLLVLFATAPAVQSRSGGDGSPEVVAAVLREARTTRQQRNEADEVAGTERPAFRAIVEAVRPLPVQRSVRDHGLPAPRAPTRA